MEEIDIVKDEPQPVLVFSLVVLGVGGILFSHSIGVPDLGFEQVPQMARRLMRMGRAFNAKLGHDGEGMRKEGSY